VTEADSLPASGPTAPAGGWRRAVVADVAHATVHGVTLRLEVPDRVAHLPGQHYVVRLTAEDGYTAQRSYSVASDASDPAVELYVERIDTGEVSPYLADVVAAGDELDIRGPIGGWFVWRGDTPAVGIAGGSGVVPIIAMLRHARGHRCSELLHVIVSARTLRELPYAAELSTAGAVIALTREATAAGRPAHRLTQAELGDMLVPDATYYVCGSAGFAEATSTALVELGVPTSAVRVERFGPSG
jgi:ferredoxin-NADP reductase